MRNLLYLVGVLIVGALSFYPLVLSLANHQWRIAAGLAALGVLGELFVIAFYEAPNRHTTALDQVVLASRERAERTAD